MTQTDPILAEQGYALQSHLGYRLTAWRIDFAQVEQPVSDHILNRQGLPHGGVHAVLLDTAMGYAGCFTGDAARMQMCLTLSMTVNFVSRPRGQMLIATARRVGGGASTFFAEGEVADELGEVVARGTGVFRYRKG